MALSNLDWSHSYDANPSSAAPVPSYPDFPTNYHDDPPPYDPRELRERARAGSQDVRFPWFLPYFDPAQTIHETAEMRAAYRRMLGDPNVKAALYGKIMAVAGYELKIVPFDRKSDRDNKIAELVRWNLTEAVKGGLPGLVWSIFSGGLTDGYSLCEKVWDHCNRGKYKGAYYLRALKPKDVGNDLIIVTDDFRNVTAIRGLRYNPGIDFPPSAFVHYRHLPLYDVPTGQSDLRAAYSRWWLLDTALKLRAVGIDKRALPVIVGHYKHAQDRPALESVLARVKSQNWLAVPETVRVEALSLAGAGDGILASAVRDLAEDIFLAIAGATLQARQGDVNNARGSSAVHRNTADLFIRVIAQAFEWILNDHETGLIPEIVDLNVEGEIEAYPRAILQADDDDNLEARSKLYQTFWEMGIEFSKQAINDEFGFEPPDPEDQQDVLGGKADQEAQVAAATLMARVPPGGPAAAAASDRVLIDQTQTGAQDQQQAAGVTGTVGGLPQPTQPTQPTAPAQPMAESSDGRWITIGGHKSSDGKRKGGSPVFVRGGRIEKGAPSLTGKKIGNLKGGVEGQGHRKELRQGREYERAVWGKKARQANFNPDDLHGLADDIIEHDRELVESRKDLLRRARTLLTHYGYDARALTTNLRSGRVEDEIPHLDVVADSLLRTHPEQFGGYEADPAERLKDLLTEGNPAPMSAQDAYEHAWEQLERYGGGASSAVDEDEPIPFDEEGESTGTTTATPPDNPANLPWKPTPKQVKRIAAYQQAQTPPAAAEPAGVDPSTLPLEPINPPATSVPAPETPEPLWKRLTLRLGGQQAPEKIEKAAGAVRKIAETAQAATRVPDLLFEEIARQRGLSDDQVARARKITSFGNAVAGALVNIPDPTGTDALSDVVMDAVGRRVPLGTLAYLAYSTARDPMASYRAAKELFARRRKGGDAGGESFDEDESAARPQPRTVAAPSASSSRRSPAAGEPAAPTPRDDYERHRGEIIADAIEARRQHVANNSDVHEYYQEHYGHLPDQEIDRLINEHLDQRAQDWHDDRAFYHPESVESAIDGAYADRIVRALPARQHGADPDFAAIYAALQQDPTDRETQAVMNDWLEDRGLDQYKFYFDPDEDHPRARPFDEQDQPLDRTVFHPPPAGAMPTPSPGVAPTPKQSPADLTQGGPNVVFPATDAMQRPEPARTQLQGRALEPDTHTVGGADRSQYQAQTQPYLDRTSLHGLSDDDLKGARFAPPEKAGNTLNASVIGRALVGGKVAFYKGYDADLSAHEERMADLLDEAGVATPATRQVSIPGAPSRGGGVISEFLDAPSLGDLVIPPGTVSFSYDDARRSFDERVRPTLQPGEIDRAVLASFLLGVEDRHLNNYLVKDGRIYSIDHEFGLFSNSKPLRPSIIARNKLALLGWPSMEEVRFDPVVVGQMASAAGRISQKLAGTPEGDAVQLQGEALLRLMESGDTSLSSLTKILKDMRTERPEV